MNSTVLGVVVYCWQINYLITKTIYSNIIIHFLLQEIVVNNTILFPKFVLFNVKLTFYIHFYRLITIIFCLRF